MTYMLWSDDGIEQIKREPEFKQLDRLANGLGREFISLIDEANQRHNDKMLQKDIEIAELRAELNTLKAVSK